MTERNLPYQSIAQETAGRSAVFWVSFCYLFAIAPHFRNLPIWVSVFVLLALGWRAMQNLGRVR